MTMVGGGSSIGQYYPAPSPLHALDPRAKLLAAAALVVGLFLVDSMAGMLLVLAAVGAAAAISRVPPGAFGRLLRPVLFIVALTALFQVLFSREGPLLVGWGPLEVHEGGVRTGVFLALRIALLVTSAALVTATTPPVALADAMEDLLSPLRRLRFPAHEMAMMMTIALRFIPTLDEEAQKIMRAQAARGADFSEGGVAGRLRAVLPVLVPLTVGAFRRADELAEAMESRGYRGGEGRTRYRELRFGWRDAAALGAAVLLTGGAAAL
ncbi:cobalt transport protein [Rubrobacter xylanophilus DSM 9941]|uniref:Cobalt transport protein n=1 Tax=Rubrobacter xylanophilus (strain DSM 9941 / JCM 11954 / NBRC 16129 / PRD-1) TaxID=266117 RepID=Q1AU60_RUBXD|nr:CbiQ family ECF transporter T component [Rubrobacter xylanophilus]ABG05068.1 cobalt transport protein [Rubrobacter xylanophilus DSM 9941]